LFSSIDPVVKLGLLGPAYEMIKSSVDFASGYNAWNGQPASSASSGTTSSSQLDEDTAYFNVRQEGKFTIYDIGRDAHLWEPVYNAIEVWKKNALNSLRALEAYIRNDEV